MKQFLNLVLPLPGMRAILYETFFLTAYVLFVLLLFQPFGTQEYRHPHKYLQLVGYGLIILLGYPLLKRSLLLFKARNYFFRHEALIVSLCFSVLIFMAFFYHGLVIEATLSWKHWPAFMRLGAIVMLPPFVALLYHARLKAVKTKTAVPVKETLEIKGQNQGDHFYFNPSDVFYLRSNGNYVMIYFQKDGVIKHEMVRNTLSQVAQQLPDTEFITIHRSFMVNAGKFDRLIREEGKPLLLNRQFDIRLPVSRNHLDVIDKKLKDHS